MLDKMIYHSEVSIRSIDLCMVHDVAKADPSLVILKRGPKGRFQSMKPPDEAGEKGSNGQ